MYKVNGVTCESLSVGIFVFPALVISFKTIWLNIWLIWLNSSDSFYPNITETVFQSTLTHRPLQTLTTLRMNCDWTMMMFVVVSVTQAWLLIWSLILINQSINIIKYPEWFNITRFIFSWTYKIIICHKTVLLSQESHEERGSVMIWFLDSVTDVTDLVQINDCI